MCTATTPLEPERWPHCGSGGALSLTLHVGRIARQASIAGSVEGGRVAGVRDVPTFGEWGGLVATLHEDRLECRFPLSRTDRLSGPSFPPPPTHRWHARDCDLMFEPFQHGLELSVLQPEVC